MATESPDDTLLLARIQQGNRAAFATLVQRHHTRFYRLAYRYMASREEAEDIVQAAFLRLWEYPDSWRPEKQVRFTTWFYRIVVNACLDGKRKVRTVALPDTWDISDDRQNQEEDALVRENRMLLSKAISALPERQKTALLLCIYEQLSHKEAASVMKISVKALQSLLMRAKTELKTCMRD